MKDIPAFPFNELNQQTGLVHVQHFGMTLRDYFAAKAMQAVLSRDLAPAVTGNRLLKWAEVRVDDPYYPRVASKAYQVADAMLKAREAK